MEGPVKVSKLHAITSFAASIGTELALQLYIIVYEEINCSLGYGNLSFYQSNDYTGVLTNRNINNQSIKM